MIFKDKYILIVETPDSFTLANLGDLTRDEARNALALSHAMSDKDTKPMLYERVDE